MWSNLCVNLSTTNSEALQLNIISKKTPFDWDKLSDIYINNSYFNRSPTRDKVKMANAIFPPHLLSLSLTNHPHLLLHHVVSTQPALPPLPSHNATTTTTASPDAPSLVSARATAAVTASLCWPAIVAASHQCPQHCHQAKAIPLLA